LELCCTRGGAAVLTLPVGAMGRLSEPVGALDPAAIVIAGDHACDDAVARWAYALRQAAGDVPFLLYHRGSKARCYGSGSRILPTSPLEAGTVVLNLPGVRIAKIPPLEIIGIPHVLGRR
jgi:hypothetical protein